jgi:hypothetical protein
MLQAREGLGDDHAIARPAGVAGGSPSVKDAEPTPPDRRG